MPTPTAVLCGLGTSLPDRSVTNDQLIHDNNLDSDPRWILERTGIQARRMADTHTSTGDLASAAGTAALHSAAEQAGPTITPDIVLLATTTPDHRCPATAPAVAHRIGLGGVPALDLSAACAGFVYALTCAKALITAGIYTHPLIIGAETYTTTLIDPHDRDTAILFGDGAAAALLRPGTDDEPGALLTSTLGSDGARAEFAHVPAGGSRLPFPAPTAAPRDHYLRMNGSAVFTQAVRRMTASALHTLAQTGWTTNDVEAYISHQANQRIINAVADRLQIPQPRRHGNLRQLGNTAAASIPLAIADAADTRSVKPGARTLLTGFGAGLAWGAHTMLFPDARPHSQPPRTHHEDTP
ncbi:beta-ketoacyl-ACP synthase 3 [Streptomyces sp. NBC_00690]|uniref:beta-ketoacyl-ACP synthase 3 n=1 Tax=Streptomyces sp. NBC_00690 TaxID=2975808 RepID=UPI002E28D8F0|nr:beta-ketoacyl-ACP synthase 3 [Streptomyces sp. NBC_00690]